MKKQIKISETWFKNKITDIDCSLAALRRTISKPTIEPIRATIYEGDDQAFLGMRFNDQFYTTYSEKIEQKTKFTWTYQITSQGITLVSFKETGISKWSFARYWSLENEEDNFNCSLASLPYGSYADHVRRIKEHFSKLPAWSHDDTLAP